MKLHELKIPQGNVDPAQIDQTANVTVGKAKVQPGSSPDVTPELKPNGLVAFKAEGKDGAIGTQLEHRRTGRTGALRTTSTEAIRDQISGSAKRTFRDAAMLETDFKSLGLGVE
ncbi:MAG: hypothetical protein U1E65_11950 [Myxococcota bacterium]